MDKYKKEHYIIAEDEFDYANCFNIVFKENGDIDHYVDLDGDRLFTRDEVTIILKKRLNKHLYDKLNLYHASSIDELAARIYKPINRHLPILVTEDKLFENYIEPLFIMLGFKKKGWKLQDTIMETDNFYLFSFCKNKNNPKDGVSFIVNKRTGEYKENSFEKVTPYEYEEIQQMKPIIYAKC